MARKISTAGTTNTTKSTRGIAAVTEVRNSSVPPKAGSMTAGIKRVTHEAIARRAYEIYSSDQGGTQLENWLCAETELVNQR